MKVTILDHIVKKNVLLFKELIRRLQEKKQKELKKTFRAWIHRKNGQLKFPDLQDSSEKLSEDEWKPIQIQMSYTREKGPVFEITDWEKPGMVFDCYDMQHGAYRSMVKTLYALNELCSASADTIEEAFQELFDLELQPNQYDFIEQCWYEIDRMEAEDLLKTAPIGAYLFRKGEYAPFLEEELEESGYEQVQCFTISYKEWNEKIGERIIIYHQGKWQFFNDDLELSGPIFYTVNDLLKTLGSLKQPLWRA